MEDMLFWYTMVSGFFGVLFIVACLSAIIWPFILKRKLLYLEGGLYVIEDKVNVLLDMNGGCCGGSCMPPNDDEPPQESMSKH